MKRKQKPRGTLALLKLAKLAEKKGWKAEPDLGKNHDKYFVEAYENDRRFCSLGCSIQQILGDVDFGTGVLTRVQSSLVPHLLQYHLFAQM